MSKITIIDADSQQKWDDFVAGHEEANFLHAWAWGDFHLARGKAVVRRIAMRGGRIVAAYVGQVETAKRGTYMAIAGGPIMDWGDNELVKTVFADIKEQGIKHKCVFVRIRPQITDTDKNRKLFEEELGLKSAPIYLSVELAGVLDITKNEEEILAGASQGLRRKIRKAQKNNIQVSTSTDPADIAQFYQIQLETAARHKFVEFSESFLKKQFEAFTKYGEAVLYTAKLGDEILAQNFMIFYGNEASYHYGVSTALGTKYSGAPLLHMQAMRDARERGIKRYNFWGITGIDETEHRFYGVSQFKRSFGVEELQYLHAHDLVINATKYKLDYAFEKIRAKIRHV